MSNEKITVITPSYSNDYQLACDLCRSMDKNFGGPFLHLIVVPGKDYALFESLNSPNRKILKKEDLLRPYGFQKIPFPTRLKIPGIINIRFHEQWYHRGVGRVNGWIIQQLIKLSASELTESQIILFIDSDNFFIRKFDPDSLHKDGKVKLTRSIMSDSMHSHIKWHESAISLLDYKNFSGEKFNYIGQLIVWRKDVLKKLQSRIAAASGIDWRVAFVRKKTVSEYILYGVFCEMLAQENDFHVFTTPELTCSFWVESDQLNLVEMRKRLHPSHVSLHIQSTIPMPIDKRRSIINNLIEKIIEYPEN